MMGPLPIMKLIMPMTAGDGVSWAWSGPGGFTSTLQNPIVSPAIGGVYAVTITDANGITQECFTQLDVTPSMLINGATEDALCNGSSDGTIDILVNGGLPPITFDWDNDGPDAVDDDFEDLIGLAAGTYSLAEQPLTSIASTVDHTNPAIALADCPQVRTPLA